jgi:hypothetical protein
MPAFNTQFNLDVQDLDLIETALRQRKSDLSIKRMELVSARGASADEVADIDQTLAETHDLLGRLHNQKVWYRPAAIKGTPYIGG